MPLPFQPKPLDADAAAFIARSGATDRNAINAFVRGVKALGLWNNMVCWPLRSSQNAGTGDTVYSLGGLGTFNGTLVNGPGWTADGLTVDADNERITTSFNYATALPSLLAVVSPASAASTATGDRFTSNDQSGTSNGIGFDTFPADQFRRLTAALANFGTRVAGARTMVGVGWGTSNTFTFQNGTRTGAANASYNASTQTLCPIGAPQAGTALGTYSFTVALDGVGPSDTALSSLYNLYKTTLGTGLGLP